MHKYEWGDIDEGYASFEGIKQVTGELLVFGFDFDLEEATEFSVKGQHKNNQHSFRTEEAPCEVDSNHIAFVGSLNVFDLL